MTVSGSLPLRNDVKSTYDFAPATRCDAMRCARAVHEPLALQEGVGNAGCPLHPRPRVRLVLVRSTRVTTSTPESPGVPARNGFNGLCRALVSAKSARMCERAVLTNRPSLDLSPFVLEGREPDAAASTASHPASVTIAIRPCCGTGWREVVEMICPTGEAKYFCKRDSTRPSTNRPTGKSLEPVVVHVDKLSPAKPITSYGNSRRHSGAREARARNDKSPQDGLSSSRNPITSTTCNGWVSRRLSSARIRATRWLHPSR